MTTVAIVGAGDIGGATALALATSDAVGRVLIVDVQGQAAAGKALDIQQAGAIAGFHTRLEGTDDLTRVTGCSVCIVADRLGDASGEWTGDPGLAMMTRLIPASSGAPIVFAGTGQGQLIQDVSTDLGVPRSRLAGSAPEAFVSAMRAMVALEARCSPLEVSLAVLGRPPRGLVVPWSDVSIGGHTLEHRLEPIQITRLEAMVDRLWPPGPYALGLAAARVAIGMVTASRRTYSILSVLNGEFGVKHGVGVIPASLAGTGIASTWTPLLTSRESVRLLSALNSTATLGGQA